MENIPIYWKTSLGDIEETLKLIQKGKIVKQSSSAGKRPIYLISYGTDNSLNRTANLSSALGAGEKKCYADKSRPDYRPTILLAGCIHGGEFEGVAALLNLIKLIETGTDYAGKVNEFLEKACEKVNILIIPCLNPDGRSRIDFSTMVGKTFDDLRYYNQGTWKDGSSCGYPECKKIHPIKGYCDFMGAYFNDDGVNLMHDDFFGKKAPETQFLFDAVDTYAPDFTILLHGGASTMNCILKPTYVPDAVKKDILALEESIKERSDAENLAYRLTDIDCGENAETPCAFNLVSALYHICGEPCVTYESNQGLKNRGRFSLTHSEIYRSHIVLFEEAIKHIEKKGGMIK